MEAPVPYPSQAAASEAAASPLAIGRLGANPAAKLGESLGLPSLPMRRSMAVTLARETRLALYDRDFERSVMEPRKPLLERLAALAQMQAEVLASSLLSRDRIDIADEFDRYGMRLLWRSRLVETLVGHDAPP